MSLSKEILELLPEDEECKDKEHGLVSCRESRLHIKNYCVGCTVNRTLDDVKDILGNLELDKRRIKAILMKDRCKCFSNYYYDKKVQEISTASGLVKEGG